MLIEHGQARRISAEWHWPGSALASLSTAGYVNRDALLREIAGEVQRLDIGKDRRELLALCKYVRHRDNGPWTGHDRWSALWSDAPVEVHQC